METTSKLLYMLQFQLSSLLFSFILTPQSGNSFSRSKLSACGHGCSNISFVSDWCKQASKQTKKCTHAQSSPAGVRLAQA